MSIRRSLSAALFACSASAAAEPAAAQAGDSWQFAITPRVQYLFLNFVAPSSGTSGEEAQFAFYGGTVEVTPPWWRNVSFLVTVLDGNANNLDVFIQGLASGKADFHRLDIEALARYRLEGTSVSLFGGFRHVRQRITSTLNVANVIFTDTGTNVFENLITFYLAEVGAGFATPIDRSGEHSFFGNGILGFGAWRDVVINRSSTGRNPRTQFAVIFDINVGYNWQFAACCAFQARYRAFVFPAGVRTFKEFAVGHGPEIGLTYRFSLP
jgi:hypothetical protein